MKGREASIEATLANVRALHERTTKETMLREEAALAELVQVQARFEKCAAERQALRRTAAEANAALKVSEAQAKWDVEVARAAQTPSIQAAIRVPTRSAPPRPGCVSPNSAAALILQWDRAQQQAQQTSTSTANVHVTRHGSITIHSLT